MLVKNLKIKIFYLLFDLYFNKKVRTFKERFAKIN